MKKSKNVTPIRRMAGGLFWLAVRGALFFVDLLVPRRAARRAIFKQSFPRGAKQYVH